MPLGHRADKNVCRVDIVVARSDSCTQFGQPGLVTISEWHGGDLGEAGTVVMSASSTLLSPRSRV